MSETQDEISYHLITACSSFFFISSEKSDALRVNVVSRREPLHTAVFINPGIPEGDILFDRNLRTWDGYNPVPTTESFRGYYPLFSRRDGSFHLSEELSSSFHEAMRWEYGERGKGPRRDRTVTEEGIPRDSRLPIGVVFNPSELKDSFIGYFLGKDLVLHERDKNSRFRGLDL